MLLWIPELNLGCYKRLGICSMNSNFDKTLNDLDSLIPVFDLNSFTIKDIVPPKAQRLLANTFLSEIMQNI